MVETQQARIAKLEEENERLRNYLVEIRRQVGLSDPEPGSGYPSKAELIGKMVAVALEEEP